MAALTEVQAQLYDRGQTYCRSEEQRIGLREAVECARTLIAHEGGDPAIVLPAVMLHDVGWSRLSAEEEALARDTTVAAQRVFHRHAVEGANLASQILIEHGFPQSAVDEIVSIIMRHEQTENPLSKNDAIVKDAIRLAQFTKEGFAASCTRFRLRPEALMERLTGILDRAFLTTTARLTARLYLARQRLHGHWGKAQQSSLTDRLLEIFLQLGDRVVSQARRSLEDLATQSLRQRLMDIRKQLELHLSHHPSITLAELQADPQFQTLAVQRVLSEGYTGIIDIGRDSPTYGQIIFHSDRRMLNKTIAELQQERPAGVVHGFWDWYLRAVSGEEFISYYRSKDSQDRIREKVQCVTTLHSGQMQWSLVISAYADEFFQYADAVGQEIARSIDTMLDEIASSILNPLSQLVSGSEVIAAGDLGHRIKLDVSNEFSVLAACLNSMMQSIQDANQKLQDSAARLSLQRDDLHRSLELIRQQQSSIAELSAPAILVGEHILVLPLVGIIDQERGQRIIEQTLQRVVEERARRVLIDVTGVVVSGPQVAQVLLKTIRAIGLLGGKCTLTGVSPELSKHLASTMEGLDHVHTAMNLAQALRQQLKGT